MGFIVLFWLLENTRSRLKSEVGGVKPKVPLTGKASSEFDVFALSRYAYASRDVRDVRACRACDVARATDQ